MGNPERLLPAYESLARLMRAIVREEIAPILEAVGGLDPAPEEDGGEPCADA